MERNNSICAEATVGTISGYEIKGQKATSIDEFAEVVQTLSEKIYSENGIYISTVISPAVVSYNSEWGCPPSGEPVFRLTSDWNSQFQTEDEFRANFLELVKRLKEHYGQATVTVVFKAQELCYLK